MTKRRQLNRDIVVDELKILQPGYDYSGVIFKKSVAPIKIRCDRNHPTFEISYDRIKTYPHLFQCPICKEEDIFQSLFDNKKCPDHFEYASKRLKKETALLDIHCTECNSYFTTKANNHFNAKKFGSCETCRVESSRLDFFSLAKKKHGEKFTYLSKYKNKNGPIDFNCPNHGKQTMTACRHLESDTGCPKCSLEEKAEKLSDSREEFIEKASAKFPHYDFSKVVYKNSKSIVTIICPEHGEFENKAEYVLRGTEYGGCLLCAYKGRTQKKEKGNTHTLYFLRFKNNIETFVKIGITSDLNLRFNNRFKNNNNIEELLVATIDTRKVLEFEKHILKKFNNHKYNPKLRFGGETECFNINCEYAILKELEKLLGIIIYE